GYARTPEPPGYKINEAEAPLVRAIFERRADGMSIRQLVVWLARDGHRTRSGKPWARTTVRHVLANPAYAGTALYNRRAVTEEGRRWRDPEDWIEVPVPAIVSATTFARAKEQSDRSREFGGRPSHRAYLLRGLLRCSVCGGKYVGD